MRAYLSATSFLTRRTWKCAVACDKKKIVNYAARDNGEALLLALWTQSRQRPHDEYDRICPTLSFSLLHSAQDRGCFLLYNLFPAVYSEVVDSAGPDDSYGGWKSKRSVLASTRGRLMGRASWDMVEGTVTPVSRPHYTDPVDVERNPPFSRI